MRRTGIDFCSITEALKVNIAEKMDFFSQVEFEMSSKHGKEIVQKTSNKLIFNFKVVICYRNLIVFMTTLPEDCPLKSKASQELRVPWEQLREIAGLIRFSARVFYLEDVVASPFLQFCEAVEFDSREVIMDVKGTVCPGAFVAKLLPVINITKFDCEVDCCPVLFNYPDYWKMPYQDLYISELPDAALVLLQSNVTLLKEARNFLRIAPTANLILLQWVNGERDIKLFRIQFAVEGDQEISFKVKTLFFGIPFAKIGDAKEAQCSADMTTTTIECNDAIYTIERGEEKLAVMVCGSKKTIQAEAFTDEKEIFGTFAALKLSQLPGISGN